MTLGPSGPFLSTPLLPNGPTTPGDVYVSPGVWSVMVDGRRARYTIGMRAHRSRTTI